mmetsp:Transcript_30061/g.71541  ORF Transcript_30061/g.71541 Transcript_30061/m.71541 type:complete len:383 (+) Transcript_30061:272-1420(+)
MKTATFIPNRRRVVAALVVLCLLALWNLGVLQYLQFPMRQAAMYLTVLAAPKPGGLEHANFTFPSVEERVRYYMGNWYDASYNGSQLLEDVDLCDRTTSVLEATDRPCIFDQKSLRSLRLRRTSRGKGTYEHDALKYFSRNESNARIIFQFGDALVDDRWEKQPVMVKSRSTSAADIGSGPILALLNEFRHYGQLSEVRDYTPWGEKVNAMVFRGNPTGTRAKLLAPFLHDTKNPNLDFALIASLRERLTVKKLMKFKYFLVLPGNDVSTGLKWMLYSNSVVFMPRPSVVSWAMEDMLVPNIHYIQLKDDLSDLEDRLEWAMANDGLSQNISKWATQYMIDLYASPQARSETDEIRRLIAMRYHRLHGGAINRVVMNESIPG